MLLNFVNKNAGYLFTINTDKIEYITEYAYFSSDEDVCLESKIYTDRHICTIVQNLGDAHMFDGLVTPEEIRDVYGINAIMGCPHNPVCDEVRVKPRYEVFLNAIRIRRNAMTIMDYFKEKPERATIYLVKRGCGHVSEFETEEGKTMEESIEDYLCSAGLCEFCPAKPCDDVCEDRLKKWLNLPVDELGGWTYGEYANSIDDLDPENREAVQKILDAAAKNAREKKVMFYPSGMADLKKLI